MVLKNSFGNSAEVHKHNLCIHKFDSGRGKRRMGERERERERDLVSLKKKKGNFLSKDRCNICEIKLQISKKMKCDLLLYFVNEDFILIPLNAVRIFISQETDYIE